MDKPLIEQLMDLSPEERSAINNKLVTRYLIGLGLSIAGGFAVASLINFGMKKIMPVDIIDNNL